MKRVAENAPALVLFDIDGTLIRKAGPHHREVLVDAARAVTGLETSTEQIPVQGMLDRDILAWMLRDAGMGDRAITRAMPAVVEKAQALYVRRCPDLRGKVCPGVRGVLALLRRRGVRAGLVTGNLSRIGWTKMRRAGLDEHFSFGAFAEQGKTRAELVKRALGEARKRGWITRGSAVALFGDHQNDILAAQANGVRAVAVATGLSGMEELAALGPDFLLEDLRRAPLGEILTA